MDRREFLKTASLARVSSPIVGEVAFADDGVSKAHGTVTIDISTLEHDGAFLVESSAKPEGKPLLIIRQKEGEFEALSMRCTHKGCKVETPKDGQIHCPCHDSVYDLNGVVVDGPAPDNLAKYKVTLDAPAKKLTVEY